MLKRSIAAFVATLTVSLLLFSQAAGITHLMGTVTAVAKDTVTIKDKDGKSVIVMLEKATKYLKDKKAATAADIKVGASVMIDAKMDTAMKMYSAQQIEVTAAQVTTPASK